MLNKGKDNLHQSNFFERKMPPMPEDYYSGDKPNPNLRAFVEAHIKERPYDPETDNYDIPAFDKPIETTKATAIYNMHTYWSKKPHDAIRQYIRHYTKPGDLVLDPFCGSGGTALAALMEGRKAIAIDLSPAATFITAGYTVELPLHEATRMYNRFLNLWLEECSWLYEIPCPECGRPSQIHSVIHSDRYECLKCLTVTPIFYLIDRKKCPHCQDQVSVRKNRQIDMVPISISLSCKSCRTKGKYSDKKTINSYMESTKKVIAALRAFKLPHVRIPEARLRTGRMRTTGTEHVDELYYPRSLCALVWAFNNIHEVKGQERMFLQFCLTSMCLFVTKMHQANENTGGNISKGSYYVPPINKELNVFSAFERKASAVAKGCSNLNFASYDLVISTESATELSSIPPNSIDFIFTDPPYSDKIPFSDLNLPWEVWLGLNTHWTSQEIIVHPDQNKGLTEWRSLMSKAFSRMYASLKPGRWLTLCYHDTSEGSWSLIQDIAAEVGFVSDRSKKALYIDMFQKSFQQRVADKVNKRDLVINFRKPKPGEVMATFVITGNEDETTFNEKVRQIIRDYIGANPGCTKDRIFDEVVSRMVRSGQMEAHDFEALLHSVAVEVKTPIKKNLFEDEDPNLFGTHELSRWYLKETELAVSDAAETACEGAAAKNLTGFMEKWLKDHPDKEGVHYSDLFEHYIYAVKDKPRRHLTEFLPDYFYKTDMGAWRSPTSEEEERAKHEARVKGLGRLVKRYLAQLEQGAVIAGHERPNDATLAEWIRHCKRAGLYEQGKLLFEKGGLNLDNLSEEVMVSVEEDYQVCTRMLARSEEAGTGKKHKRRKE